MANKKCGVCGGEYDYCLKCEKTHAWKFYACSPEHYQIHMVLDQYRGGVFDKEMATDCFARYSITADKDLSYLLPEVERDVRLIIGKKPIEEKSEAFSEKKNKKFVKTDKE